MNKLPIIVSASRMTDMPAFYPAEIIKEFESRRARGTDIHTIVLWTKHIQSLFREPLFNYLKHQQNLGTQLYIQLTITGMGKETVLPGNGNSMLFTEPCVPAMEESLELVDKLIELIGNPERIRLRVDPLVRLRDAKGEVFSNYIKLKELIDFLSPKQIKNFTFSFLEKGVYDKIDRRFLNAGIDNLPPGMEERQAFSDEIGRFAAKRGVKVTSCAVPGLSLSACIDGKLLQDLHDQHWPLDLSQPHSRELCGCTKSTDIGGWPPKTCASGCIYCYSRPKLKTT